MTKLFPILLILLISCTSESSQDFVESEYSGVFTRVSLDGAHIPSTVFLTLKNGTFTGTSSSSNYPAICTGNYEINDSKILFTNSCAFTADFDWRLILSGEFDYEVDGDNLKISRSYDSKTFDQYSLTRE